MPAVTRGTSPTDVTGTPSPVEEPAGSSVGRPRLVPDRRVGSRVVEATLVGVAGTLIAMRVVGWNPSLWRVYFTYEGDTFFNAMNGALATPLGVTGTTTRVGWPYGLDMTDFPAGEPLFTWLQWLFSRFTQDQFTVLAALWFLGFFLVGAVGYLCLRGLGFTRWPAVVAALVYDFVPFHLWRATGHTNLALYLAVPLGGMILLWFMAGRLDRPPRSDPARTPLWRTPDWWAVGVGVLVVALSARYYTVFFLLLLALVTAGRLVARRRLRPLWPAGLIAAATLAVALLSGLPQILQTLRVGGNAEVALRPRTDSDLYSLRLTDLLAPIPDHRLEAFRKASAVLRNTITRGEDGNSLGLFLLAGVGVLLAVVLVRRWPGGGDGRRSEWAVSLADHTLVVTGLAFLIGTVGGLGGVIASAGYTQVRSWNRISIYVSFGAAVGLALGLTWLWGHRGSRVPWRRVLPLVAVPLVLVLAVLDQTGTGRPSQADTAEQRDNDRTFFTAMADQLGTGASVYQLPYVAFPESGGLALNYAGYRGFFNDGGRLNYSYGGMRGRESDWQRTWAGMDLETQLVGVAAADFSAVLVDRVGYTAENTAEPGLTSVLGAPKGVSPDGRLAWYDLRPVREKLLRAHGRQWVDEVGGRVVRPIGIQVKSPTYRSNGTGASYWGSLGASSTIELRRYDADTDPVDVRFRVRAPSGYTVRVSSGEWQDQQPTTGDYVPFEHEAAMSGPVLPFLVTTNAPNTADLTDPRPDVRAELDEVSVLDHALAEQIARGELHLP